MTSILDRQYFRSIYFREPGGTLLELGRALKLPKLNLPSENNGSARDRESKVDERSIVG